MIYLDYQSTTPVDKRVLNKMLPYFSEKFANVHSNHFFGEEIKEDVETARHEIAKAINAESKEIIFTSGATEANNLAIKGLFHYNKTKKNHIISSTIEHKCVLESLRHLETHHGAEVTLISPGADGIIAPENVEKAIRPNTLLISIMAVNNEIGTIQPLQEIGTIAKKHSVFFHSDAAQAIGKIELDVKKLGIDLLSISGHKIYGPKGIGALYASVSPTRIRLTPIFSGGGQERNFRSGTLPVPLCIGLGEAIKISITEMEKDNQNALRLRNLFLEILQNSLKGIHINGSMKQRIPQNLNLAFEGIESESLIFSLEDIALTSVSACSSEKLESSYVLSAIKIPEELSHASFRVSLGRFSTENEIKYAAEKIISSVNQLREISPLWNN